MKTVSAQNIFVIVCNVIEKRKKKKRKISALFIDIRLVTEPVKGMKSLPKWSKGIWKNFFLMLGGTNGKIFQTTVFNSLLIGYSKYALKVTASTVFKKNEIQIILTCFDFYVVQILM